MLNIYEEKYHQFLDVHQSINQTINTYHHYWCLSPFSVGEGGRGGVYKQYHGDKTKVPTNTPTSHTLLTNVIIYNFAEDNSPRAENELVYALIFHLRLALCLEKLFVLFNVLYWMNFRIHFAITVDRLYMF